MQRLRTYFPLIGLSVIWGLAFVAIKRADYVLSPVNLALLRWFVSSAAYALLLLFIGRPKAPFDRRDLPRLLLVSFANVPLYHVALNFGETTVSSGLAGLLISTAPVFVAIFSSYSLQERISSSVVTALFVAICGAAILSAENFSGSGFVGPAEIMVSAFAYALFTVASKPLVLKYGPLHTAIWAGISGTLMLLPLTTKSLFVQAEHLSTVGWFSVLYLALLSTVAGYSIFYTLVSRRAVSRLTIQLYLVPVVSVIGGAALLDESITPYTILGGAFLLTAVALATRPAKKQ